MGVPANTSDATNAGYTTRTTNAADTADATNATDATDARYTTRTANAADTANTVGVPAGATLASDAAAAPGAPNATRAANTADAADAANTTDATNSADAAGRGLALVQSVQRRSRELLVVRRQDQVGGQIPRLGRVLRRRHGCEALVAWRDAAD